MSVVIGLTLSTITCGECGTVFAVSEHFRNAIRKDHRTFYCPNGHDRWFPDKTEEEKLRERLAESYATNGDLTNKLNRIKKGVCPWCNRSFQNIKSHIKSKHKDCR